MTFMRMPSQEFPGSSHPWVQVLQAPTVRILSTALTLAMAIILVLIWPRGALHALSSRPKPQGDRKPVYMTPSDNPLCNFGYSVPNWDGRKIPICDLNLCKTREKLTVVPKPAVNQRRWSAFDEASYLQMYKSNKIGGWLQAPQISWVRELTRLQHSLGIYGSVGEIGVHHGKFLAPIVGYALADEPAVAVDLFEDQGGNYDASGRGSTLALLQNMEAFGIAEQTLTLIKGNSMFLATSNFTSRSIPAFRFFSVDGGHSFETTLHDMMLASCLLKDGGIMVLDDVHHPLWQGVAEAMFHFSFAQTRLVPILLGYNKAYFATASHAEQYREFIQANNATFTCRNLHVSRHAMGGADYCYGGPVNA